MARNLVTCAIDDEMVFPILVWAYSLKTTSNGPLKILIGYFSGHLGQHNRDLISIAFEQLNIDHAFREVPFDTRFRGERYVPVTSMARLALADSISGLHLWIDVDTVASEGWDDLFSLVRNSPPESKLTVAARNGNNGRRSSRFNAGVLGWPARSRIRWETRMVNRPQDNDQDILNYIYKDAIFQIPARYNSIARHHDNFQESGPPEIIHYAGPKKPWHMPRRFVSLCLDYQCPWAFWFKKESEMLAEMKASQHFEKIKQLQIKSLSLVAGFGATGDRSLHPLKALQFLGFLGWLLIYLLKPFRSFLPRGSHPFH